MPSNFSSQETLNDIIANETMALHEAEAFVRVYWSIFVQDPTNTSLATVYGAFLALTSIYRKMGCMGAIPQMLAKLEPALFHILEHSDRYEFELIYPHVDILLSIDDVVGAKRIAQRCIKLIMSKNKDLTRKARRELREHLQFRFMGPIEERLKWQRESLQMADSMTLPDEWFAITPRSDSLELVDRSYGLIHSGWQKFFEPTDESDEEMTA